MTERYFHVSYGFVCKNKNSGLGSIWVNLVGDKVTREVIQDWKKFITKQDEDFDNIVILFYSELEG